MWNGKYCKYIPSHFFLLIESSCGRDCGRFCEHMRAGFFWWSYGGRQFIMFNIEFNIQLNILFKFILLNIHIPYIFKIHIVLLLVVIWRSFTLSQSAYFFVSCYCFKFTHFLHCSYFNFPLVRFWNGLALRVTPGPNGSVGMPLSEVTSWCLSGRASTAAHGTIMCAQRLQNMVTLMC